MKGALLCPGFHSCLCSATDREASGSIITLNWNCRGGLATLYWWGNRSRCICSKLYHKPDSQWLTSAMEAGKTNGDGARIFRVFFFSSCSHDLDEGLKWHASAQRDLGALDAIKITWKILVQQLLLPIMNIAELPRSFQTCLRYLNEERCISQRSRCPWWGSTAFVSRV